MRKHLNAATVAYVYDRLSAEETRYAEIHLAKCPKCQENVSWSREMRRLIKEDTAKRVNLPAGGILEEEVEEYTRVMDKISRGCPDDESLCGFVDGILWQKHPLVVLMIKDHLRKCQSCTHEGEEIWSSFSFLGKSKAIWRKIWQ